MFLCGFVGALALPSAYYGKGIGLILLNEVACTGIESSIFDCDHVGFGNHKCFHKDDLSAACEGNLVCIHVP